MRGASRCPRRYEVSSCICCLNTDSAQATGPQPHTSPSPRLGGTEVWDRHRYGENHYRRPRTHRLEPFTALDQINRDHTASARRLQSLTRNNLGGVLRAEKESMLSRIGQRAFYNSSVNRPGSSKKVLRLLNVELTRCLAMSVEASINS
jgi:hypothetical protein